MTIYSTKDELAKIAHYLTAYMRIPYFQDDTIPGKVMEKIISLVRGGEQLATYDYVDVCISGKVGWQVKSTKNDTPLTWKRAKIANSEALIKEPENEGAGLKDKTTYPFQTGYLTITKTNKSDANNPFNQLLRYRYSEE